MNNDICTDNRFDMVKKYLELLKQGTNIETSQEEMRVIENILFRFWQMGWLDKIEFADTIVMCKDCKFWEYTCQGDFDFAYGECSFWPEKDNGDFLPETTSDHFCIYGERKE